jgi:hypothetical protein
MRDVKQRGFSEGTEAAGHEKHHYNLAQLLRVRERQSSVKPGAIIS